MTSLSSLLERVKQDLSDREVRWALIGGLAVGVWTEPRFTRDVDLAIDVESDQEAEELVHSLHSSGYRIAAVLEHAHSGRLATVRLLSPYDSRLVDLLFASTGIESVIVEASRSVEVFEGVTAPVASIGHLIAMKVLARNDVDRPRDLQDLRGLLGVASEHDLEVARAGLAKMSSTNHHRGRDLIQEFETLLG